MLDILLVWLQNCFVIPTADICIEKCTERKNHNKGREEIYIAKEVRICCHFYYDHNLCIIVCVIS